MSAALVAANTAFDVRVNFDSAPYGPNNSGPTSIIVKRSGTVNPDSSGVADWAHPKYATVGDAYTCRCHQLTGPALVGSALDSDLPLTSDQTWTTNGNGVYTGTLTLKKAGVTLATANVTWTQSP